MNSVINKIRYAATPVFAAAVTLLAGTVIRADKTELTREILEQDKKAYINGIFPIDFFTILFAVLLIGSIVGIVVSIAGCKKNRRMGADAQYLIRFIGSAIACGAATLTFAGMFGFSLIATVLPRWFLDQKINVDKTVITNKFTEYNSHSNKQVSSTYSYILTDDAGEKYMVEKDVYDNVEIGGEYYCARLGSMNNCINIYDTDVYEYNK